ncbi:hypothetical protein D1AOALGA4SA_2049 [Olavius algarvensis Delta 1 endosymbiont]|nr:hypothetical protein D1AOALGA4SA_2049 [Olavius algarvensis Delta 1 endosymbiont]
MDIIRILVVSNYQIYSSCNNSHSFKKGIKKTMKLSLKLNT